MPLHRLSEDYSQTASLGTPFRRASLAGNSPVMGRLFHILFDILARTSQRVSLIASLHRTSKLG
jgi:hypothetical protein